MKTEDFQETKKNLLLAAGDIERAEEFNRIYEQAMCTLALETRAVDDEVRATARAQMQELRKIVDAQVKFLRDEKQKAMVDELDTLPDDAFKKA